MAQCEIPQGFFTARPCEESPEQRCESCKRRTCVVHGVTTSSGWLCLECNAKAREAARGAAEAPPGVTTTPTRPVTTGRFRYSTWDDPWLYRRTYWSTGPLWTSHHDYGVTRRRDRDNDGDVDADDATYSNLFDS